MRPHLLDPTEGDARLSEAIALAREIYALYESGSDYTANLKRLGLLSGHPVHGFAVHAAFGSAKPETFARRQLIAWDRLPADLTQQEMLEMIEGVCGSIKADEIQREYWLACLRANTGDNKIGDLIFWPGTYFGDGNNARVMSAPEILATALKAGRESGAR